MAQKSKVFLILTRVFASQPILADEVQTFKALITVHKVLQEGHPIALREAQANVSWLESLSRGLTSGDGIKGTPWIPAFLSFLFLVLVSLADFRKAMEH